MLRNRLKTGTLDFYIGQLNFLLLVHFVIRAHISQSIFMIQVIHKLVWVYNYAASYKVRCLWKILEIFDSSEGADLGLEWFSQTNPGFWEFDVLGQGGGSLS